MNSRQKGKRVERLARDFFRDHGFSARRGVQYQGGPDSPDVVVEALPSLHLEVKGDERLNVHNGLAQAIRDAEGLTPVLMHKKNGTDFLITMRAADWIALVKETDLVKPQP